MKLHTRHTKVGVSLLRELIHADHTDSKARGHRHTSIGFNRTSENENSVIAIDELGPHGTNSVCDSLSTPLFCGAGGPLVADGPKKTWRTKLSGRAMND